MNHPKPFIDEGFRPNISKRLTESDLEILDIWHVPLIGEPVESERPARVAVWFGRITNSYSEFPVIATVVDLSKKRLDEDAEWYCGVAINPPPDLTTATRAEITDAANYMVEDARFAIKSLKGLLPIQDFRL